MIRMAFALAALVGCCNGLARAETLPLYEGLPNAYTPGTAFTFTVRVPRLNDFVGYSVDLIFSTDVPDPPLFVSARPVAAGLGERYVFPSNANFQSGSTLIQGSPEVLLTFRDSTGSPVTSVPGANDTLAVVTVRPGADLTGPIVISLGAETTFDANAETTNVPPPDVVIIPQADGPSAVPAPPGVVLAGLGALLLAARKRVARSMTTA